MDEAKEEMAVRYVLGGLPRSEEQQFRATLEQDRELREFTREIQEAFASLALAAPPVAPPMDLPARIVRENPHGTRRKVTYLQFIPWALAACLAVICAVLAASRIQAERNLADLRVEDARLQKELVDLRRQDLLSQVKIAMLQARMDAYARTRAVVVWDAAKKVGLVQFDDLPAPQPGKNYQLWVIDPKSPQPVSAGVVPPSESGLVRANFTPARPVEAASAFAVSIEKLGGSQTPQGQIILLGQ
jgi:anti-sigma-K factor RskA